MNTSWTFGGVDMPRYLAWRAEKPEEFSAFMARGKEAVGSFDKAFASWRDDVDVAELQAGLRRQGVLLRESAATPA